MKLKRLYSPEYERVIIPVEFVAAHDDQRAVIVDVNQLVYIAASFVPFHG